MDIMAGIAATSQGLSILKQLREVNDTLKDAEYKAKIVDLMENLTDAKIALVEAKEREDSLSKQISELKDALKFRADKTVRQNGLTYEKEPNGHISSDPYCPRCEQDKHLNFRIIRQRDTRVGLCPSCGTSFAMINVSFRSDKSYFEDGQEKTPDPAKISD